MQRNKSAMFTGKKFAGCVFLERRLFYRCIDLKSLKWHIIMLKSLASCANNVYTPALDLFIQLPLKRFDITIFLSPLKKLKKSLFGIATFYTYIFMQIFWRFPVINETKTRAFWGINKLRKKFFCIQDGIFLVYSTQMDTSLLAKLNVTKDVDVIWK